jgi:hypothetical protein
MIGRRLLLFRFTPDDRAPFWCAGRRGEKAKAMSKPRGANWPRKPASRRSGAWLAA